jgi:hypothetical protein
MKYSFYLLIFILLVNVVFADSTSVLKYYSDDIQPETIENEYKLVSIELSANTGNAENILKKIQKVKELELFILEPSTNLDGIISTLSSTTIQNLKIYSNHEFSIPDLSKISMLVFDLKAPNFVTNANSKLPQMKAMFVVRYGKNARKCALFGECLSECIFLIQYDDENIIEKRFVEYKQMTPKKDEKPSEFGEVLEVVGEKYQPYKEIELPIKPSNKDFLEAINVTSKKYVVIIQDVPQEIKSLQNYVTDSLFIFTSDHKNLDISTFSFAKGIRLFGMKKLETISCSQKNTTLKHLEINTSKLLTLPTDMYNLQQLESLSIFTSLLNSIDIDLDKMPKLKLITLEETNLKQEQIEDFQKKCQTKGITCIVK